MFLNFASQFLFAAIFMPTWVHAQGMVVTVTLTASTCPATYSYTTTTVMTTITIPTSISTSSSKSSNLQSPTSTSLGSFSHSSSLLSQENISGSTTPSPSNVGIMSSTTVTAVTSPNNVDPYANGGQEFQVIIPIDGPLE